MTKDIIKRWAKYPSIFISAVLVKFGKYFPDKLYLKLKYYSVFGKKLNLKNPQTFNEKLQWLKLYDRKPEYTTMVDKVEAKIWVAERIGEEYVIPTLGVWDRAEDIDFDSLPDQFVLKTNHDSGGIIICKDKSNLDKEAARKKLNSSLKRNFYEFGREWPYKSVQPKVLAERILLSDSEDGDIPDYKFMCFNGKVECCFIVTERHSDTGIKVTFLDKDWNRMPFTRHYPAADRVLARPVNYDVMVNLAERLSAGTKFLRVDFYEVNNKIYFGELTFFPGCGYEEFSPEEWDYRLGNLIKL